MIFTVVWLPSAQGQLANLWIQATDRQAITEAVDRIDHELKYDANTKGTPLGPFRAFFDNPLAVLYAVDPGDCMVKVVQVRQTTFQEWRI